jgi:Xaa-Pro aminopeptidase
MSIGAEEYGVRLIRVRESMDREGLDGLLVYSWRRGQVRYLCGYEPNYLANVAMLVVPRHEEPTLFIRFPFDLERAQAMSCFDGVRASGDVANMVDHATARLRELRLDEATIGLVSGDDTMDELPYTVFQQLVAALPGVRFRDARRLVMNVRLNKTPAEIELLKRSAAVADATVSAAAGQIAPGASEHSVVSVAEEAARSAGATDCLVVIASRAGEEQVGPPEDKAIEAGQMVIIEAAVQVEGYWTQVARTFAAGALNREQAAIYDASYRAYRAALQAIHPGVSLEQVYALAHTVLAGAGYGGHIKHDMGHGIGLDLPEPPRLEPGEGALITPGLVLVAHPAVRVPGVGGAFVGGTVLASENGPMALHHVPERLT